MPDMRKVSLEDFKNTRTIKAKYLGKSKFLICGQYYNIRFMEQRKKVSVPLCDNPHIKKSNQGIEFPLGSFYVN